MKKWGLSPSLDIQILPLKEKITEELKRVKKSEHMLLGNKNSAVVKDIDKMVPLQINKKGVNTCAFTPSVWFLREPVPFGY